MEKIELNRQIFKVTYSNGFYVAISDTGQSPASPTLQGLAKTLAELTNCKQEDVLEILNSLF